MPRQCHLQLQFPFRAEIWPLRRGLVRRGASVMPRRGTGVGRPELRAVGLALSLTALAPAGADAQALQPADRVALDRALNTALETARTGVEIPWGQADTGHGGVVVVERTYLRDPIKPCRTYHWTFGQAGRPTLRGQGTGCRLTRENWALQEDPPEAMSPLGAARGTSAAGRVSSPRAGAPTTESARPKRLHKAAPAAAPRKPPPFPDYTLPSATVLRWSAGEATRSPTRA
jgi:surface antigen